MKARTPVSLHAAPRRGVALILVLSAILFISVLIVAFFGSVNRELVSSKSYASGASSRIYADAAVNLVVGQLQAGTTQDDTAKMWVSQPGLIRVFNSAGQMQNAFKLYSSNKMVEAGTFSPLSADGAPADVPQWTAATGSASLPWNLHPNLYTDLNSPIVAHTLPSYPILNPSGLTGTTTIDGFSVSGTYALADSSDWNQNGNTTEVGQIPMPVRWMYVLTDGRIATAEAAEDDGSAVVLTTPDGAAVAADNPPVARIAFWTDDNTCRLNINTASEGNYWSLGTAPVGDEALCIKQVVPREYQRYPGHPAATSLSPVMYFMTTGTTGTSGTASYTDLANFTFALAPRISGRGSQFGTRTTGYTKDVTPDTDRLYASVDELLFLPSVNTSDSKRYRTTTDNIQSLKSTELDWMYTGATDKSMTGKAYTFSSGFSITPETLEEARFFLTTNSRAPEVNLFGQPRISLWPVDTRSDYQSVYDHLLAFCSTVSNKAFYFQRQNPDSQTEDYDSIGRNQELIAYLDHLTSTAIPGYGAAFSSKYSSKDRKETITSIFDWIRNVNLAYRDPAGTVKPYAWTYNSASSGTQPPASPGSGQVLPIKIASSDTQGYGRFPTLSKAALGIIREAQSIDTTAKQTTVTYRAMFLMETYVPMLGYAAYMPNYDITVSGLANTMELVTSLATSSGTTTLVNPMDFNDGHIAVTAPGNFETYTGRAWGGTQGFNHLFAYTDSNNKIQPRTIASTDSATGYPFVSSAFSVTFSGTDVATSIKAGLRAKGNGAGPVPVTVTFRAKSGGDVLATYTLSFPNFGPLTGSTLSTSETSNTSTSAVTAADLQTRVNEMASMNTLTTGGQVNWALCKNVISTSDIIQGVELNHGDLRLSALHGTDTTNAFVTHRNYGKKAQAHSLLLCAGSAYNLYGNGGKSNGSLGTDRGVLVKDSASVFNNSSHASSFLPQAPSSMTDGIASNSLNQNSPGDFSNGLSSESDGPHIMKADEGNISVTGMNWGMSSMYPYQNQLCPWNSTLSDSFSPNRQIASAVQLGTLPSQAATSVPWQTLLFRPDFAGTHPGANSPADYLLLDLFWMPVIDPYPISEMLSTAGKVNMNYQIVPFTYINRSTALIGALKSTKIEAIPVECADEYKNLGYTVPKNGPTLSFLYTIDPTQTLLFFNEKFQNTDPALNIFKSAAEICSIPLAPTQNTYTKISTGHSANQPANSIHSTDIAGATDAASLRTQIKKFWSYNTLTGDNTMEAPYNWLYPRLTTQSNSYTVYVRAQSLQVSGTSSGGRFNNLQKHVTGEYQGSYEIERYIDLNDTSIPDSASAANYGKTIYPYYKFRILSAKQFIP